MFDVIFMFAIVGIVVLPVALFINFFDWMARENRTFFFVKMYRKWCIKKGKRVVANAKKAY